MANLKIQIHKLTELSDGRQQMIDSIFLHNVISSVGMCMIEFDAVVSGSVNLTGKSILVNEFPVCVCVCVCKKV